jgi:sugar lactone lactonase YvrE
MWTSCDQRFITEGWLASSKKVWKRHRSPSLLFLLFLFVLPRALALCPAGTYSLPGAASGCLNCPAGTFGASPSLNTASCSGPVSCPVGTYALPGAMSSDTSNPNTCTSCPVGKSAAIGSIDVSECFDVNPSRTLMPLPFRADSVLALVVGDDEYCPRAPANTTCLYFTAPIRLNEYNLNTGSLVQSGSLPSLSMSATDFYLGAMQPCADGSCAVFGAQETPLYTNTNYPGQVNYVGGTLTRPFINGNRSIVQILPNGLIDYTTKIDAVNYNGIIKGVCAQNSSSYWIAGNATGNKGIIQMFHGAVNTHTIIHQDAAAAGGGSSYTGCHARSDTMYFLRTQGAQSSVDFPNPLYGQNLYAPINVQRNPIFSGSPYYARELISNKVGNLFWFTEPYLGQVYSNANLAANYKVPNAPGGSGGMALLITTVGIRGIALSPDETRLYFVTLKTLNWVPSVGGIAVTLQTLTQPSLEFRGLSLPPVLCRGLPIGFTCNAAGTAGIPCAPGTYGSTGGVCLPCPGGTYSSIASSSCIPCPGGTYSSIASSSCIPCPAGLASLPQSSSITNCTTAQTSCSKGQYLQGLCIPCPAGTYQDLSPYSGSSCTLCSAGTYSTDGQTVCESCPEGTFSTRGSASCTSNSALCINYNVVAARISGLESDALLQFVDVQSPSGISYSANQFGASNSSITLSSGSYLSTSLSTATSCQYFPTGNNPMTLSVFLKCPAFSSATSASVIEWGAPGPSTSAEKFSISVCGSGNSFLPGPVSVCDNKWHHVAQVYGDGYFNSLKRYVDGVLVSSTFFTFDIPSEGSSLRIGWNGGSRTGKRRTREFTVPGSRLWVVPEGVFQVNVLIVGGGGGGGGTLDRTAGGGGGGGFRCLSNVTVTPGDSIPISVGSGGNGGTSGGTGAKGGNSLFGSYVSIGGGGGGGGGNTIPPTSGGSGGGVYHGLPSNVGGVGTSGQGFGGGPSGYDSNGVYSAAGGGGAGGRGLSGSANGGGDGGPGAQCSTISNLFFSGGGGGSSQSLGGQYRPGGVGGVGGGGTGASSTVNPTTIPGGNGVRGGGGGGGYTGGRGGGGIVIISFEPPLLDLGLLEMTFTGTLADATLFNRALPASDVLKLASPPLPTIPGSSTPALSPFVSSYTYPPCTAGYSGESSLKWTKNSDNSWTSTGATNCTLCEAGTYSPTAGSSTCTICPPSTYSYNGASGCSSCNSFTSSSLISSSSGCSPSETLTSGPIDTSFYLSGSINEGVNAFAATYLSGVSFVLDHLGAVNGALNLMSGSALSVTPAMGSSITLPVGNEDFSVSVWAKCPPTTQGNLFSWGRPGGDQDEAQVLSLGRTLTEAGRVTTLAGQSLSGYFDSPGTNALFFSPVGLALDSSFNVYVADRGNNRIRVVTTSGTVTTLAGSTQGFDDGPFSSAKFFKPSGTVFDGSGVTYVSDSDNHRIRKISLIGNVSTLAGNGSPGFNDGVGTSASFYYPSGIAIDSNGDFLFVADQDNHLIRKISTASGAVYTIAGSGSGFSDGIGTNAQFSSPYGVASDILGNLYIADRDNHRIRKITSSTYLVSTLAGGSSSGSADGFGTNARFNSPSGLAVDASGNVFVADSGNHRIRKVTPLGNVTTVAGRSQGFNDDTGTNALFNYPLGIVVDAAGTIFVSDTNNQRIRKITQFTVLPACDSFWHHIALTKKANSLTYYIDGVLTLTDTRSMLIPADGSSLLALGWNGVANYFTDSFSEVRVYNRSLSLSEVVTLSQPPMLAFPDTKCQPPIPTAKSTSYSWSCVAGFFGTPVTHLRSTLDNSWYWSTGSSPNCRPCARSSFADGSGATACTLCPQGTFGLEGFGFTSQETACQNCPAGSYAAQLGSLKCSKCPAGTWSSKGSSECEPCPSGYYSNDPGLNSSTFCETCPQGTYGGGGIISSCIPCSAGTYGVENPTQAPTSRSIACSSCPVGTFSPSGALSCTYCAVGFFTESLSSISCSPCPSGTYGSFPGASNKSTACLDCPAGTYNELSGQTRISCATCPAGTASNVKGSSSSSTCVPCKPGSFSSSVGTSSCTPCRAGTYTPLTNAETCIPCPRGTYLSTEGGSSLSACLSCPVGTSTAVTGISDVADCVAGSFVCPSGTQSNKPEGIAPSSFQDCVPLACPYPLTPSTTDGVVVSQISLGSKCLGCALGTSGSYSSGCKSCSSGDVCPGLLGVPLPNGSTLIALSRASSANKWLCPGGELGAVSTSKVSLASLEKAASTGAVLLDAGSVAVVATGSGIVLFTLLSLGYLLISRSLSRKPKSILSSSEGSLKRLLEPASGFFALRVSKSLESIDAFSLAHSLREGQVVEKRSTALGGAFTVAGFSTLAVLAALLALRRQADNTLIQQSLAVLDSPSLEASNKQPWSLVSALAARFSTTTTTSEVNDEALPSLLRVRVLIGGDSDASCGTLSPSKWAVAGLDKGVFVFHGALSAKPCVEGSSSLTTKGQASIFQLQWTCNDCLLSPQSELTFQLPHACQSLALEVAAAAADGSVGVVTGNSDEGAATEGLLTSLEWQVLPLLDEIYDLRPDASRSSRRGYTLIDGGLSVTRKTAASALNASYSLFSPASSSIAVKISLELQPYFSKTTLTEKMSLLELFANIVGLAGIFSLFGILFERAEKVSEKTVKPSSFDEPESANQHESSMSGLPSTGPFTSMHRPSYGLINRRQPMFQNTTENSTKRDDGNIILENENPILNTTLKEQRKKFAPTAFSEDVPSNMLAHSLHYEQKVQQVESNSASNDQSKTHFINEREASIEKKETRQWIEYTQGDEVWYVTPSGESVWELPDGVTAVKNTDV